LKTATSPLVTVLLPTFNSATFLVEALESILNQTLDDFAIFVLDGGSSDATIDIANAYMSRDARVRLEVFPALHPTKRIDELLYRVKSKFVAIQHSDDVSYTNRLDQQVQFFDDTPNLAVSSASYRSFWHDRNQSARNEGYHIHLKPTRHDEIKANLPFWWVMHAPTLMLDVTKVVSAGLQFSNNFLFINDYWQSVSNIDKLEYGNLAQELSAYRLHYESDGNRNVAAIQGEERILKEMALRRFGFSVTEEQLDIHVGICLYPDGRLNGKAEREPEKVIDWLECLRTQNRSIGRFDVSSFDSVIDDLVSRVALIVSRPIEIPEIVAP
jgi:glycosyltransferase involved in cell wall biosynthesis